MIRQLCFGVVAFCATISFCQDINYAKKVVKTLASPEFAGRGYVASGDQLAAEFIQKEYEKIGLQSFKKRYFQKFTTAVNTFPGKMELSLNGRTLTPGVDFLIEPGSPGLSGEFQTITLSALDMNDGNVLGQILRASAGKIIVIPPYNDQEFDTEQKRLIADVINFVMYHPDNPAAGSIILTNKKLTWGASTSLYSRPSFTVKTEGEFEEIKSVNINVKNTFFEKYSSQNVVGFVEGKNTDSLVVLIAHYDHLGMMGSEAVFPGANDNASGIAMLLNLAKHYAANQPKYTTVFIAFGGEELGLVGAKYFVENPLFKLAKIKFLLNFDISGTGDDGIQVVNGKVFQDRFDKLVRINEELDLLKQVKIRGEACNSDHCMFHMNDVPCFFIYTLGRIQAYHDVYDKSETLPLTDFEDYFKLMVQFISTL